MNPEHFFADPTDADWVPAGVAREARPGAARERDYSKPDPFYTGGQSAIVDDPAYDHQPLQPDASRPAAAVPKGVSGAVADESEQLGNGWTGPDRRAAGHPARRVRVADGVAPEVPVAPRTLDDTGLTHQMICDLILKMLLLQGTAVGIDVAKQLRLPFRVIDEALCFLKDQKQIEVVTGELIGRVSYRFHLTDLGRDRARDAMQECRYVGPAPVPLDEYVRQCSRQAVTGTICDPQSLLETFHDMILREGLLEELGPAVCSGKSIFIYGPPGNGKTLVAKGLGRFLNAYGGEIYVPYAFCAENSIITVFDPSVHQATDHDDLVGAEMARQAGPGASVSRLLNDAVPDTRWRRIRRPVVITGGELTLEMLDLRYNKTANFYQAPLHIKANGGVFLIDDFGRQIVSPRDLLNRWILPLEERQDYLTLATGKKFSVPFEQLIIFSTNLDPRELVDEAFLRRIRHKILIDTPDRDQFTRIFQMTCRRLNLRYDPAAVDYLYRTFYDAGKPPRSSDPRDLLEIVQSICRFRNQPPVLTDELLGEATERFFCRI